MFRKICVIGLGSLGSYVCKYLSELDQVKHLVLVDHDIVDRNNCRKSAFTTHQIGAPKVDAVEQIISNDVNVTKIFNRYVEGQTTLPRSDLVIDCRDEFCPRQSEIDVRMFISESHLVMDFMKKRSCKQRQGHYIIDLSKEVISTAAFFAARMINSAEIHKLLKNQIIHIVDLNEVVSLGAEEIQTIIENREDAIYDLHRGSERLLQMEENLITIFNANRICDIEVFIGEEHPVKEFLDLSERPFYAVVPQNTLKRPTDIIPVLLKLTETNEDINYIVKCNMKGYKKHVYLIQESGAA